MDDTKDFFASSSSLHRFRFRCRGLLGQHLSRLQLERFSLLHFAKPLHSTSSLKLLRRIEGFHLGYYYCAFYSGRMRCSRRLINLICRRHISCSAPLKGLVFPPNSSCAMRLQDLPPPSLNPHLQATSISTFAHVHTQASLERVHPR